MSAIKCPYCKSLSTKKIDGKRETLKGYRRRWQCYNCGRRFTTLEEWCPDPVCGYDKNADMTVKLPTRSQRQIKAEGK